MVVRRWLGGTGLVVAAAISGCAVPVPIPVPVSAGTQAPAVSLSRVGRFALTVNEVGRQPEAMQGGFAWRDDGANLMLDLVTPLGQTIARVEANEAGALLREANGKETHALNPDALVALVLGSRIPVSGLRDWLHGKLPGEPVAQVAERDAQGRPVRFEQGGWQVRINQYDDLGPTRLVLLRTEPDGQEIDLRLVVNAS